MPDKRTDREVLRQRVEKDPDFIVAPSYGNSLREWSAQKDSAPPRTAARMLAMSEEELVEMRDLLFSALRSRLSLLE